MTKHDDDHDHDQGLAFDLRTMRACSKASLGFGGWRGRGRIDLTA